MRHFCWKNTQNFAIFIIVFQKLATILADVPATPAITRKPSFLAVFLYETSGYQSQEFMRLYDG